MPAWRPTKPEDVPDIIALVGEIYAEYDCVLDAEHEDTHFLAPGPYCRERGGDFWVVESGGRIVATVGLVMHEDAGELKCLYVHASIRRRGWGRRLSKMVIEFARQAGKKKMILWSDTRFKPAHRLYESLGFTRFGAHDLHDSNNTIEYGFETPL